MNFYILILLMGCGTILAQAPPIDDSLGKKVAECSTKNPTHHVWVFKQWHLSASVNTFENHDKLPQQENQKAIYNQLARWIDKSDLDTIFSEGCAGSITKSFSKKFNGWDFNSLAKKASDPNYADITTLIPLKLKAKYGDKVNVLCGDDEAVITKQNEALSDARGNAGFLARIEGFNAQPDRQKPYLDKLISIDHLSKNTTAEEAEKRLKDDLKDELDTVKKGIDDRNKSFEEAIEKGPKESALIVGGIHASGLIKLFQKNRIDCTIIEPTGYAADDEKALLSFLEPSHK